MSDKVEVKSDALPDLDDLLQCPVCYEIPSGQIFQCNEGHHVCGRCKIRLDVCPVCRALFFGTRNYAMEELIANIRKLRAFKLGGKVTTSGSSESTTPARETASDEAENDSADNEDVLSNQSSSRPPQPCKGLFRCLCCKIGNTERLPSGRLLNHLRYYHAPELIEGRSENGEYAQAWQFSAASGRIVTAVRIADMGIFFLVIEINMKSIPGESVCAWLVMATAPWVAREFCYTVTISGSDREAIFTDCVWSVRSCEGSLKKRGHCLIVNDEDARALTSNATLCGKVSVRRAPDYITNPTQPRAVLRVATRGHPETAISLSPNDLLQDLRNDVARLSLAWRRTLGREANALLGSEAEMRDYFDDIDDRQVINRALPQPAPENPVVQHPVQAPPENTERVHLSRNARRRMRQRLRAALNEPHTVHDHSTAQPRMNNHVRNTPVVNNTPETHFIGYAVVRVEERPTSAPQPPVSGSSDGLPRNNTTRANKKKRRYRR